MEALPEVVEAVGGQCEVYVDGGFSQGANIFKALALGASMVSGVPWECWDTKAWVGKKGSSGQRTRFIILQLQSKSLIV